MAGLTVDWQQDGQEATIRQGGALVNAARLIGVSASHLVHIGSEGGQLALFAEESAGRETDRHRDLAAAMDSVRSRYGREAIKIGRPSDDE